MYRSNPAVEPAKAESLFGKQDLIVTYCRDIDCPAKNSAADRLKEAGENGKMPAFLREEDDYDLTCPRSCCTVVFVIWRPVAMNRRIHWFIIAISLLFLYGSCESYKNPVYLMGNAVDWEMLAGEWKGEYFSKDTGRSGTIEFTLIADENEAYGDVLMIPRGSKEPYHPVGYKEGPEADSSIPRLLTIHFREVLGKKVRGELIPYWDPEMQRRMLTIFEGTLEDDSIKGTFESRIEQSPIYFYGQWEVFRK